MRRTVQPRADAPAEFTDGGRRREHAVETEILLAERARKRQLEFARELHIVADVGMRIERQMERKKAEIVFEQRREAVAPRARYARIFAAPEISMMDQQRIGAAR